MLTSAFQNHCANFKRGLGLLLVIFILYGTTAEAAHRHGRLLSSPAGAASQVDNEQTQNLANTKTGCNECLICQLHQNLSITLIALRLNDPPAQLPHRVASVVSRGLVSQILSPLSGRAPPFIS